MEALSNPFYLFLEITLSVVSFWFCWRGYREKDVPAYLWGIGTALPTFGISNWRLWVAGCLVCFAGKWLQGQIG